MFLNRRDFGKINFDAHVAAGHHDAVGYTKDFLNVIDALLIFNLCDDFDIGVVLVQQVADFQNIGRAAGKAGRDDVKPLLNAKQDVLLVALAHILASTDGRRAR